MRIKKINNKTKMKKNRGFFELEQFNRFQNMRKKCRKGVIKLVLEEFY